MLRGSSPADLLQTGASSAVLSLSARIPMPHMAGSVGRGAVILLALSALAGHAHCVLHAYSEGVLLSEWVQDTFHNFPPFYWNNLVLENPSASVVAGGDPCGNDENQGYQGISCDAARQYVTGIDLSLRSLPTGQAPLQGALAIEGAAPPIISLPRLTQLDLEGNQLENIIPKEFGYSPSLKRLILAGNAFSGPIPPELCRLNLTCLKLTNNRLNGTIPPCFRWVPCIDFQGNKDLIRRPQDCNPAIPVSSCDYVAMAIMAPPPPPAPANTSLSLPAIIGIVIGGLVLVALLFVTLVFFQRYRQRRIQEEKRRQLASDVESQISSRHFGTLIRFQEEELAKACDNFDDDCILGEGGYAIVYKGRLEHGLEVAIKRIKKEKMKEGAELDFLNEVEVISRAAHKNLVQSVGFCVVPGHCLMLVLHYYSNGSVASRTSGKEGTPLSWEDRQRIAKGAADGVAYLHNDCNPKLIHRDIKAENVLLDEADEAAIADFGLAAQLQEEETHRDTAVKGTIGHIAPEYILTGRCSDKTDVYAFGAFLLELVSGKGIAELGMHAEEQNAALNDWVGQCLVDNDLSQLVDVDIGPIDGEGSRQREEVLGMLSVALMCMRGDPKERPDMNEVCLRLVPRRLQEEIGKWHRAPTLGTLPEGEEHRYQDPLQWELDQAEIGDTIGSSLLDSRELASSSGNSQGPL